MEERSIPDLSLLRGMADKDPPSEEHYQDEVSRQSSRKVDIALVGQASAPILLDTAAVANFDVQRASTDCQRAKNADTDDAQHVESQFLQRNSLGNELVMPQSAKDQVQSGIGGEPSTVKSAPKPTNPLSPRQDHSDPVVREKGEEGTCRIHKYWLYETATRFYVVGGDAMERRFRLLKIDRSAENVDLRLDEDDIVYTKLDMNQLLDTLDDGNKASGGMKLKYSFWGFLGFVRFTGSYYMLIITKKSSAAVVGGHYIYQIDATELISLTASSFRPKADKDPEEARFVGILNNLDLTRSFYFSYSYDVTRTLQRNILRERSAPCESHAVKDHNSMFVWNHHFLRPASSVLKTAYDWCLPIIHGFVSQGSECA